MQNRTSHPQTKLKALCSKPDYETLSKALRYLDPDASDFKIKLPGPKAAQLVNALVANIIPDYWSVLGGGSTPSKSKNAQKQSRKGTSCLNALAVWRAWVLF
jgi:telomere length regulation protein